MKDDPVRALRVLKPDRWVALHKSGRLTETVGGLAGYILQDDP